MKKWLLMVFALVLGAGMVMEDAEARRLGGARSLGAQRQMAPQKPAQQQQATQQQNAANPAAAQGARSGMGRWLAPLAGLAVGLGLASLFGEQMGSLLVAMLIAAVVFFAIRALLRGMGAAQRQRQPMQYAGADRIPGAAPPPASPPPTATFGGSTTAMQVERTPTVPAGFDSEAFVREAKRQFVALQAANDKGDVESIRDFVTDELYADLKQELDERQGVPQQTDVVTLEARLEEIVTEGLVHWASIRFSGMLREEGNDVASQFEELWHLQKPATGNSGWLLAGIQQVE